VEDELLFGYGRQVKLTVQVRLLPDAVQAAALRATVGLANQAANLASDVAWERRVFRCFDLHRLTYSQLRALGLAAQPSIRVIKKVADAYTLDRRTKRSFRADAAQPFDDRCLSWQPNQQTVSIWTIAGRLKGVRFAVGEHQKALLAHRKGESDLLCRDGKWYLHATCEVPEAQPTSPSGFLGVDLGIVNIATTSDKQRHAGCHLNRVRHRNQRLRAKLQQKGTKSTKRLLKHRRRKEVRFATDTNHVIAKRIVAEAERTGRGIALEDLQGIRGRVRLRRPSGPRCTPGRSTNSAASSPTRPSGPAWWSSKWTRPTPRRPARPVGTWSGPTARIRRPFSAGRAALLGMPTGTRPATSPSAVWRAGLRSASRTRTGRALPELQAQPFSGCVVDWYAP
jgi:putative transposase